MQEALTNVIKHGAAPAALRLDYGDEHVTIEVTNALSVKLGP